MVTRRGNPLECDRGLRLGPTSSSSASPTVGTTPLDRPGPPRFPRSMVSRAARSRAAIAGAAAVFAACSGQLAKPIIPLTQACGDYAKAYCHA